MSNNWRNVLTVAERMELQKIESELSDLINSIRSSKKRIHNITQKGPQYLKERREMHVEIVKLRAQVFKAQERRTLLQGLRYRIQNRASKRSKLPSHNQVHKEIAA